MHPPDDKRRTLLRVVLAVTCLVLLAAMLRATAAPVKSEDLLFGLWRLRHALLAAGLLAAAFGFACAAISREALLGFWATLLSLTGLFVLLELAGRAGYPDWSAILGQGRQPADATGWSLQPDRMAQGETGQDVATLLGLPHDPIPFSFHTDRHGFRNGAEPEGEIILLGDSIVLGAAVPFGQTAAEMAEEALGRPVMQAALLGLSIQAQQDMLRAADLPLAGKTVVQVVFEGNDLLDSRAYRQGAEPADAPGGGRGSASLLRTVWELLVPLSNPPAPYSTCEIDGQMQAFLWTRRSFDGVEAEFSPVTDAIAGFRSEMEAEGAGYALVLVPTKYRVLHRFCSFPPESPISDPGRNLSRFPAQLADWSRQNAIDLLDLTEPLVASAAAGDLPWFWGDTHWNATGHAVAGREIARWLQGTNR